MSRVIKLGTLDQQRLQQALLNAKIIELGRFDWTITDVVDGRDSDVPYIFGNLSKFAKHGQVTVVDESAKQQVRAEAQNLLEASAPFVYLPEYSGIAYMHVWNGIQEEVFSRRFKAIVESVFDNFFVGCHLEPVSDYRAFHARLKSFERFTELSAKVYPPNPLFGRLWGSLNDYVKKRKASEVLIKETSDKPEGISTNIVVLIQQILDNPQYQPEAVPDVTDAALLMAADGYGAGKAVGVEGGQEIVVRTSDTQKSFLFSKEPVPEELAKIANAQFSNVSRERDMGH